MKTYHIGIVAYDCTEVCANTPEEAEQLARDIFRENGYNLQSSELTVEQTREECV